MWNDFMNHMGGYMGGYGWNIYGLLHMALFWGLVVAAVFFLARAFISERSGPADKASDPLTILKERYARGEIDRDEYESKRADLMH